MRHTVRSLPRLILTGLLLAAMTLPASAAPQAFEVTRYAGANQIDTAIAISEANFADHSAKRVILARSNYFADAVAGAPLAVRLNAPILLTETETLNLNVMTEIQRVLAPDGGVTILGGVAAVSHQVEGTIEDNLAIPVSRIGGRNRFATSQQIMASMEELHNIAFVSGENENMATALLASVNMARNGDGVVIYTTGAGVLPDTDMADVTPFLAGKTVYNYDPQFNLSGATLVGGANPTEVSVNTATLAYRPEAFANLGFASANPNNLADALAGGPVLARKGAPLLLLNDMDNSAVAGLLTNTTGVVTSASLFGGPNAISDTALASAFAGHTATFK